MLSSSLEHVTELRRNSQHGRVLVIDEFDKAPAEVVIVIKSLLEDGELLLGDGRLFVSSRSPRFHSNMPQSQPLGAHRGAEAAVHKIHPHFRVFALANRPGEALD